VEDPIARRDRARKIRVDAAEAEFQVPIPPHPNNGDEERYPNKIGNSTKGLHHDSNTGEVVLRDYDALIDAINSGKFADFEALATNGHLGCDDPARRRRFVNPMSGYAFDLEGTDSHQLPMPPAPAFASAQEAGEMVELYWMALLRDVNFDQYTTNPVAHAAAEDLSKLTDFRGPKEGGKVTPQTLFRDHYFGCTTGPYVSQFLLQPVAFGSQSIDTRIQTYKAGLDYVTTFAEWLDVINGCQPAEPNVNAGQVYAHKGRDIAAYVHVDALIQAYFVAMLNLLDHTNSLDKKYYANIGNPYGQFIDAAATGRPLLVGVPGARAQIGFGTFGSGAIIALLSEVSSRALKDVWYQKWLVHRRLRPEEFGGRVEAQRLGRKTFPFDEDLFRSTVLVDILSKFGSHLLPQAFPEGSPLHTAYGSGHATVAGACVTVLKAFFDESQPIQYPVMPNADGTALVPYTGPTLTVGGELNKIASNISQARNIAGVHWRTDAREANLLGEAAAISILTDMHELYSEPFKGYTFTKFDGTKVTIGGDLD
jgi:membrane-associated phospholipid phosphatase